MPGFNQTGPMEQGSMSGRRMGRCTNYGAILINQNNSISENNGENQPGNLPGRGLGMGRGKSGRGRGMGRQNRFRSGF